MGKFYISIFFIFFINNTLLAQERYLESSFEVLKETYTYATKDAENLDLDIYLPEYDAELERPMILFVHGGGFSSGQRDSEDIQEFCTNLSSYGYVVASISYRLTRKGHASGFGCNCPVVDKLNTFNAAVEDIQDATFFIIENRHQFAIDPQKIILAGSSAGAEAVLNTAYQPPFCYGLNSGPVAMAGVIGFAGAIPDTVILYDESAVPSLLFHGTDDKLVPYATAPHHYCSENDEGFLILHGSKTIADKLTELEVPYWLHTTCGGGHEISHTPMHDYFDIILEFCHDFVIQNNGQQRHTIEKSSKQNTDFETYNFCTE